MKSFKKNRNTTKQKSTKTQTEKKQTKKKSTKTQTEKKQTKLVTKIWS